MARTIRLERGLQLGAAPLWFDPERRRPLCVLTTVGQRLPSGHLRAVASAPLAEALARAGHAPTVLGTPWRRAFGLGGLRLELVDACAPLGGSAVLVDAADERLLVVGALREAPAPWPLADHVVVELPAYLRPGIALDALAPLLAARCERLLARGAPAHISVDHLEAGLALAGHLAAVGMRPHLRGVLGRLVRPGLGAVPAASLARRPTMALADPREPAGTLAVASGYRPGAPPAQAVAVRYFAAARALGALLAGSRARRLTLAHASGELTAAVRATLPRGVRIVGGMHAQALPLAPSASAPI